VGTYISNAKSLLNDTCHKIKREFLQEYLNEFCYKFNRRYFGEDTFERQIMISDLTSLILNIEFTIKMLHKYERGNYISKTSQTKTF
jgi:hypothetical protein